MRSATVVGLPTAHALVSTRYSAVSSAFWFAPGRRNMCVALSFSAIGLKYSFQNCAARLCVGVGNKDVAQHTPSAAIGPVAGCACALGNGVPVAAQMRGEKI